MQEAKTSKAYGEQNRIIIPHTFKHEMGIPSIDRKTEILMKVRVVMVCVWCVWCVCVCARACGDLHMQPRASASDTRSHIHLRANTRAHTQTREQPKNPPRAAVATAKDLIYSSAPPPQAEF